jgi:hypothetical protein
MRGARDSFVKMNNKPRAATPQKEKEEAQNIYVNFIFTNFQD